MHLRERASEDAEMEEGRLAPERQSPGSQILTPAELISSHEALGPAAGLEIDVAGVIRATGTC